MTIMVTALSPLPARYWLVMLVEARPSRFYLPAYIASRGWVALRLDTGKVDWDEVRELLLGSYMLIAPSRLAEQVKSLF